MQTRSLRTLVKIRQVGSFAIAADQLNMTLSAVSMQMKTLEEELNALLFDRSFRPPKLTPLGRAVSERAVQLLGAEDDLVRICSPSDRLVGRFRAGFVSTASVRLLPGFLMQAAAVAPRARFDLQIGLSEALEEKVLAGQLDFAVLTASSNPDPRLEYALLREEELAFAVPAHEAGKPLTAIAAQMPFLHFAPGTGIGKLIAKYMSQSDGQRPEEIIVLDGVEAILECVKAGIGFTLLPVPDISHYGDDRITMLQPDGTGLTRQIVLTMLEGSPAHGRRKLLEALF
ncbi:LysR family transcriptional regulator [Hoeflea sp. TYP-13]|uniref:LysR family transcriptional regulator n=1 Tax=Hoeflea sp. TYP-13 TaxID=3230023 RepID=UPI0034C5F0C5